MHKFNVYDMEWNFIEEFWSYNTYGIDVIGDYITDTINYTKPVYFKRMS